MNRYLFLDIDGVLNTERHIVYQHEILGIRHKLHHNFDPIAMQQLARIVVPSNTYIIISSTWRLDSYYWTKRKTLESRAAWEAIIYHLALYGMEGRVIGVTPSLFTNNELGSVPRGLEIRFWLNEFASGPYTFAILDDDSDMDVLMPWHCKCDARIGITEQVANKAIKLLYDRPADLSSLVSEYDNKIDYKKWRL